MVQQPLDDLSVLDFSQAAAAPFAATLLSDYGADVVSVEPPGGAAQREVAGRPPNVMRNKRSICIDLKKDGARTVVKELVEDADVLIENNRPGVMDRLGYGYETVSDWNSGIVYCSVTGFGQTGPYKDRPAVDPVAQAMSGLMSVTGEPDRKPSRVGASIVDLGTGLAATYAIFVALWERERTGDGTYVDASLLDTAASVYMAKWLSVNSQTGTEPQRMGSKTSYYAPVGIYETGGDSIYISVPFQSLWERFCTVIDKESWIDDERFETVDDRIENRDVLDEKIEAEFETYSEGELVEKLTNAGVPTAEVQTVSEVARDEHLLERESLAWVQNLDGEEVLAGGNPVRLSGASPRLDRPPGVGEHAKEVLEEAGFSDAEIDRLQEEGVVNPEESSE
jgi:crotonobetainyl-CoA:carnitine CoA-transferase CaiB-like acyl-CoA transferase